MEHSTATRRVLAHHGVYELTAGEIAEISGAGAPDCTATGEVTWENDTSDAKVDISCRL